MIPYTIMLEPGLIIHKVYNGYWYWGRSTPEELRQDFRAISQKCRPDWDLSAPGMRDKWEPGKKECLYPYQKNESLVLINTNQKFSWRS